MPGDVSLLFDQLFIEGTTMKNQLIAVALLTLAAGAANASCATASLQPELCPPEVSAPSTLTRAEVLAEVRQAQKDGTLAINTLTASGNTATGALVNAEASQLTRDQVRAEARQATRKPINVYYPG